MKFPGPGYHAGILLIDPKVLDPDTDMPQLPDNHFWRIKENAYDYLYICVMKKGNKDKWWSRDKTVIGTYMRNKKYSTEPDLEATFNALANRQWDMYTENYYTNTLTGDYPPKRREL